MTADNSYGKLVKLGDTDLTIADKDEDVRGRHVVDKDGLKLGKIDAILVDDKERKIRFLEVETGGFLGIGERKSLIPIDAISRITEHEVHIDQTGSSIAEAPAYDPTLVQETVWADTYRYYGYVPYWGVKYTYGGMPHFKTSD